MQLKRYVAEILGNAAEPPEWFLVFGEGVVRAQWEDGSEAVCLMNRAAGESVIEQHKSLGRDAVIDWEHQSEGGMYSRPAGDGLAPAAGWIKGWKYVDGEGLYVKSDWVTKAAEFIKAREYRYFSPVFWTDEKNQIFRIKSIALTNSPALTAIEPIAAKSDVSNGVDDMKNIAKLVGLAETATEDQIVAAITARSAPPAVTEDAAAVLIAKSCGITATNAKEFVAAVATLRTAGNVDPTKFVARADFDSVKALADRNETELKAIRDREEKTRRDSWFERGAREGKITATNRKLFEAAYRNDPAKDDELLKDAPVLVNTKQTTTSSDPAPTSRTAIIATAARKYRDETTLQHTTSEKAYVNDQLRIAKERAVTDQTEIDKAVAA